VSSKPYIIVRISDEGSAAVVYETDTIKSARYWLNYIALPGDAIFITSAHPKYNGSGKPTYQMHLVGRGKLGHEESEWRKLVPHAAPELNLPMATGAP
jgi:hypothetical protein